MRAIVAIVVAAILTSLVGACGSEVSQSETSKHADVAVLPKGIPPGSVPQGAATYRAALAPPGPPITPVSLVRGRERYGIYCTPCHGATGQGDGAAVRQGYPAPPTLHDARIVDTDPGRLVAIINLGIGRMYGFAEHIPPLDQWAIAYYVKSLQAGNTPPSPPSPPSPPGGGRP